MTEIVRLAQVVARDDVGAPGRRMGRLNGLFWSIGAGVHAVLGRPEDGTVALGELLAGRKRPRAGSVRIAGRDPAQSFSVRRRIGSMLPAAALCGRRVADAVRLAQSARGGDEPLARFGLQALAARQLTGLAPEEARAVDLAIALSLTDALLVVLYEPFALVAGIDQAAVRERLRELSASAAVVLLCSAPADALCAGDRVYLLSEGRWAAADEASGWPARALGELSVWLDDADGGAASALANALAESAAVAGVSWTRGQDGAPSAMTIRARDLDEAAQALAQAAAALACPIRAVHAPALDLDRLVAAARARLAVFPPAGDSR